MRGAFAQHFLGGVLGQALVVGEIIGSDELALQPVVMVVAKQCPVGGEAAYAVFRRDGAGGAQFLFRIPEMEMLHCALVEVLPLGDRLRCLVSLDDSNRHAALAELDRKAHADRSAAKR